MPLELDLTFLKLSVFILKMGTTTVISIFQGLVYIDYEIEGQWSSQISH